MKKFASILIVLIIFATALCSCGIDIGYEGEYVLSNVDEFGYEMSLKISNGKFTLTADYDGTKTTTKGACTELSESMIILTGEEVITDSNGEKTEETIDDSGDLLMTYENGVLTSDDVNGICYIFEKK